ncbi:protein PHYTOCHROME KINASE SUBSTRATE 2-like [Vigna radiata var. radiata]|uniref:Protein PHYTOCHROME KINASE SUBSTRATE 2-like n=1 Tax=Vigna radiata var. radiata TaxID=3916 RepID=A0A3Q0EKU2_VIGRR|nr:protein PHYTOCHROME KINASE SUBSTRATE 2-like [Vigna radiata var. radiata]
MVISEVTSHQLQTFNSQNNNIYHLRDASFSSYLNSKEEILAESGHGFASNRKDTLLHGVKKEDDGEIGVFGAEKYFNGEAMESPPRVANNDANKNQPQKDEQTALVTRKNKVQYGTPSVRSESSLNSQSALLQSGVRNSSKNMKNKLRRKSFLASLGCKCYCSDSNSVDISDHAGEINCNKDASNGKTTSRNIFNADPEASHLVKMTKPHEAEILISRDAYFQRPEKVAQGLSREKSLSLSSVTSSSGNQLVKLQLQVEKPRNSLEVFGSPILDSRSKSLSFDRRLAKSSWEAAPKIEETDFSENYGGNYNDAESDASSDLFEIESLTGKSNSLLARSTSNIVSSCASPTTCYAPSEASIEWSVATASALEYSTMSDYDDQRSIATTRSPIRTSSVFSNVKPKVNKEMQRRRPSILLGCKSQKAVGVAGDAFTAYDKPSSNTQIRRRSDTYPQVTEFKAETKEGIFGSRHKQHANATPPLQRSLSPHPSQLLYI